MYEQFHIDHKTSLTWNVELMWNSINSLIFSWSANSCSRVTILNVPQGMKGLSDLSTTKYIILKEYKILKNRCYLSRGPGETQRLGLLDVRGGVRVALDRQRAEGGDEVGVAGHEVQPGGALHHTLETRDTRLSVCCYLRPGLQTRVQTQLGPLVITARPVTAPGGRKGGP